MKHGWIALNAQHVDGEAQQSLNLSQLVCPLARHVGSLFGIQAKVFPSALAQDFATVHRFKTPAQQAHRLPQLLVAEFSGAIDVIIALQPLAGLHVIPAVFTCLGGLRTCACDRLARRQLSSQPFTPPSFLRPALGEVAM